MKSKKKSVKKTDKSKKNTKSKKNSKTGVTKEDSAYTLDLNEPDQAKDMVEIWLEAKSPTKPSFSPQPVPTLNFSEEQCDCTEERGCLEKEFNIWDDPVLSFWEKIKNWFKD